MLAIPSTPEPAVVYTHGLLKYDHAKTAHGVLRGSARFAPVAVIDSEFAGQDAGEVMDGRTRDVPVFGSLREALRELPEIPKWFLIGVAFSGGRLPEECRPVIKEALEAGLSVVNGLHQGLAEDPVFAQAARRGGAAIVDIRKPRPFRELSFWTGAIYHVKAKVVPVLGTDCALGKRTTARWLMQACRAQGMKAEMIFTGQTGWMQGSPYGFIFDATPNDFISGEIERAVVECDRAASPDVIFIEGQGALRNPSGPCGSEFLISGNAAGAVLQHAPSRTYFVDHEDTGKLLPTVEEEIALIRMLGVETVAVTLNEEGWDVARVRAFGDELAGRVNIPVVLPLSDGVEALLPAIKALL